MADPQAAAERIRAALAEGPTPGEWTVYESLSTSKARLGIDAPEHSIILWGDREEDSNGIHGRSIEEEAANAALIAACSPEAMTALLAERDALRDALHLIIGVTEGQDCPLLDSPTDFAIAQSRGIRLATIRRMAVSGRATIAQGTQHV